MLDNEMFLNQLNQIFFQDRILKQFIKYHQILKNVLNKCVSYF